MKDPNDYARYVNITLIDNRGAASSTQMFVTDRREALEYFERKMTTQTVVAAFIFDTLDGTLIQYKVDGLRAIIF